MLRFRKTRHFFTQSSVFYKRKQPKTSFPGSVFRVEIGVFLVKFVIFVYFQLRSPTNVLLERTQKNPVAPYGGFVAWRLQNGLFFVRKSRFSCVLRALNCSIFGLFEYFRCPNIMPPLVLKKVSPPKVANKYETKVLFGSCCQEEEDQAFSERKKNKELAQGSCSTAPIPRRSSEGGGEDAAGVGLA